jgi:hypothetical protein
MTKLNAADMLVLLNIAMASMIGQHVFEPNTASFKVLVMLVAVTHAAGNMLSKSAAAGIAADQDVDPAKPVVTPTAPEVKP